MIIENCFKLHYFHCKYDYSTKDLWKDLSMLKELLFRADLDTFLGYLISWLHNE